MKNETLEEAAEKLTNDFPALEVRFNMTNEEIYGWFLEALQKGANNIQENLIKELELRKSKEMNSFFRNFYTEIIELIKK